ncbi:MAG: glycosyltransferase [Halobacteriales archaeon]|nr:glycosyltransferase [Halobacteriales archaeon]
MRIAMVGPTHPHRASMVHYTHSLANALARTPGTTVRLLTYYNLFPKLLYKGGEEVSQAPLALDPAIQVDRLLSWGNPLSWRRAARALAGADVLHLQSWTGLLAPGMLALARAARRRGIPVLVTLHNVRPHELSHRLLSRLTRRLLHAADLVVVHADSLVEGAMAEYGLGRAALRVVPQGRYDDFDRHRLDRAQARRLLDLPPDATVLLCFGTIRDYKGLDVAIRTLALLPANHLLLVAGHCWEPWEKYAAILRETGTAGRVRTDLRYIPDEEVEAYFKAADVSLLPYKNFEGQSAQALTAATFGVPIVASRLGGLTAILLPEFLVEPTDTAGFAAAVQAAARRGASTVRPGATPTWAEVAAQTVALYAEAAA